MANLDVGLIDRLSNALVSYVGYVCKLVWPVHLAVIYPFPVDGWPVWKPILSILLLAAGSGLVLGFAKNRPYLTTGWIWYIVTLVPVIGLVQIGSQAMADRYTYLPSIGIFILVAWGVAELTLRWPHRTKIVAVLAGLAAVAMIAGTRVQASHWRDSASLYSHTLSATRNNYLAHRYMATLLEGQGQFADAENHYRQSIESCPGFVEAHLGLGQVLEIQKKYAEALQSYERAMQLDPNDFLLVYKAGVVKAHQGQLGDAVTYLRRSIRMNPDFAKAHFDLGVLLQAQGSHGEAAGEFRIALNIDPNDAKAWGRLGNSLQDLGRVPEAVDAYQRSLKLAPGDASIHYGLAQAFKRQGRLREAIAQHRNALQANPQFAPSLNNLAWILATNQDSQIRNPSEAVHLAEQLCQLTSFKDENCLDTLAAAYAGAGRFDKAIDMAQIAIALAENANRPETVKDITGKLQLYQARQPYLEP